MSKKLKISPLTVSDFALWELINCGSTMPYINFKISRITDTRFPLEASEEFVVWFDGLNDENYAIDVKINSLGFAGNIGFARDTEPMTKIEFCEIFNKFVDGFVFASKTRKNKLMMTDNELVSLTTILDEYGALMLENSNSMLMLKKVDKMLKRHNIEREFFNE